MFVGMVGREEGEIKDGLNDHLRILSIYSVEEWERKIPFRQKWWPSRMTRGERWSFPPSPNWQFSAKQMLYCLTTFLHNGHAWCSELAHTATYYSVSHITTWYRKFARQLPDVYRTTIFASLLTPCLMCFKGPMLFCSQAVWLWTFPVWTENEANLFEMEKLGFIRTCNLHLHNSNNNSSWKYSYLHASGNIHAISSGEGGIEIYWIHNLTSVGLESIDISEDCFSLLRPRRKASVSTNLKRVPDCWEKL